MQWESCLACSHLHSRYLVPENVKQLFFLSLSWLCVHARPLRYLDMPYLFGVHVPCMCMHVAHARCDITRFAYNMNHIMMMSSVFMFHSCHIGMRWHDDVGACIA